MLSACKNEKSGSQGEINCVSDGDSVIHFALVLSCRFYLSIQLLIYNLSVRIFNKLVCVNDTEDLMRSELA